MRSTILILSGLLLIGSVLISDCYPSDTEESDEMDEREDSAFLNFDRRGGPRGAREHMDHLINKQLKNSPDKVAEIHNNDKKVDVLFQKYQKIFRRDYETPEEEEHRRNQFKKNLIRVIKTNENPQATHVASINSFSDLSKKEFNALKKGLIVEKSLLKPKNQKSGSDSSNKNSGARSNSHKRAQLNRLHQARQFSPALDWLSLGRVTSVKNQMQCGDCYAFATTAVLEALWQQQTGNLVDFSPQQLTDCSIPYGNHGCDGGFITKSIDYLNNNGDGVYPWAQYNFTNAVGTCLAQASGSPLTFGTLRYTQIPMGDENQMLQALNQNPVWIGLNAAASVFQNYHAGVISSSASDCPSDTSHIDHAVTLVGYGNDPVTGLDYWKIKNSWGTRWGEDGYMRIARGSNVCGVATFAISLSLA